MSRVIAPLLAVLVALSLTSCGQDDPASEAKPRRSFTQADVDFVVAMQSHHQQALSMSELAENQAGSPDVRHLAEQIAAAQGPEIDRMASWLRTWPTQGGKLPGHGEEHHVAGMMGEDEMAALEQASGREFDRMWLEMMIRHHQGALQMAREQQRDGRHPGATHMATTIEKTQSDEIRTMKGLLADL